MGLRGPKPVDAKRLEDEAARWASFFYTLRDGQPGYIQRYEMSEEQTIEELTAKGLMEGNPSEELRKQRVRVGRPSAVAPVVLIPIQEAARQLPATVKAKGLFFKRPVMPRPAAWKQLSEAQTAREVRKAVRNIGELRAEFVSSLEECHHRPERALSRYAKELVAAKRFPHYPKTDREHSDDKRVVFLAKAMAGLTLGLASITAIKRLSHWSWPKDWAARSLRDLAVRQKQQFFAKKQI